MGLDYEICYKKGKENIVADALSMVPGSCEEGRITAIVSSQQLWLGKVIESYQNDVEAYNIITGITVQDEQYKEFLYPKRLIKSNNKVYVGMNGNI